MNKSLNRDVQVLAKMLSNINDARDVILRFKVNFDSKSVNSLYKNKDAFDLCSFYMAQFGEKVKLLTDSTKDNLSKVVDLNILKYFRNIIDHDYESVNKILLQSYISMLVSNEFRTAIIKRLDYCKNHKR